MSFDEIRFPEPIGFGSSGGPMRRTEIVTLGSGFEERNTPWAQSRRRYQAGYGIRTLDDLYAVIAFFEAREGELRGFRFKDVTDWTSTSPGAAITPTDQRIGTGDGVTTGFDLTKTYGSPVQSTVRPITKPVEGSVRIAVDGNELIEGIGFDVEHTTGRVSFLSGFVPSAGAAVMAGFEFDVPVRFDTDHLSVSLAGFKAGELPNVPLIEIKVDR